MINVTVCYIYDVLRKFGFYGVKIQNLAICIFDIISLLERVF